MNQSRHLDQDTVIEALKRLGANAPCPRCGNAQFTLLNGYDNILINRTIDGVLFPGGPQSPAVQVPTVLLACDRCGYLSAHALGALGLLPVEEESR